MAPNVGIFWSKNDEKEQKAAQAVMLEVHFEVWFVANLIGHQLVFTASKSD